jgi:hypothetical protein
MDKLPIEFQALTERVSYVRRKNDNEYSSSCPQCGGTPHENGSLPDRFVMWVVSRNGNPFGMCCRGHCGYKWSPAKQDANWTEEEREEFQRKQKELEVEYELKLAEKMKLLTEQIQKAAVYKKYFEDGQKNKQACDYWENVRYIPREWQEHLQKGYMGFYTVKNSLTQYQSPAYTNPVWVQGGKIENIKLRVQYPLDSNDRFRNMYKSGCQHLYMTQYEKTSTNKAVIVEGENKCDAVTMWGHLPDEYTIYGVQSKQPERRILNMLSRFEVVYLALDPDAYTPSEYTDVKTGEIKISPPAVMSVAKQIGMERVRFVVPPNDTKFDDAIFKGFKFVNAVNMAVKAVRV